MQIEPTTQNAAAPLWNLERARDAMNAAYNALSVDAPIAGVATSYVHEARREIVATAGHEAPDGARAAARAVLPRLDHALTLLATLATATDPMHVTPLLDELGFAMDHVETVLAGAGWD